MKNERPAGIVIELNKNINILKNSGKMHIFRDWLKNGELDMIGLAVARASLMPVAKSTGSTYGTTYNQFMRFNEITRLIIKDGDKAVLPVRRTFTLSKDSPEKAIIDRQYHVKPEAIEVAKEIQRTVRLEKLPTGVHPTGPEIITDNFLEKMIEVLAEKIIVKLIKHYDENKKS